MKMVACAYVKYGLSQFHYIAGHFFKGAILMHYSLNFSTKY